MHRVARGARHYADDQELPPGRSLAELLRARRAARSATARAVAAQGLCDVFMELPWVRQVSCVAVYDSDGGGPGTDVLRTTLVARGVTVLPLPTPTSRRSTAGTPSWPSAAPDAEVYVLPALAVDTLGRHLPPAEDDYDGLVSVLPPTARVLAAVHDDEIYDVTLGALPGARPPGALVGALTPTRLLPFLHANRPADLTIAGF